MTPDQELAYLAAFIDGEGYVSCRFQCGGKKLMRRVGFVNTEKDLFDAVVAMLNRAGFETAIRARPSQNPKHADRWDCYLVGGKDAYKRFLEIVPLQHPGKRQRLSDMVSAYLTTGEAGRKRAKSRSESLTPERRREISAKALAARWEGHTLVGPKRVRGYTREQQDRKNELKVLRARLREAGPQS